MNRLGGLWKRLSLTFLTAGATFAAVHDVSWGRAATALGTAFVCIALVANAIL